MREINREEIHRLAEKLSAQADEAHRKMIRAEEREKPIPPFLFHATTRENVQQILKEGIDPSELLFSDEKRVCLSDDPNFALRVASETQGINIGNLVLLRIDTRHLTPAQIENYLRAEDPEEKRILDQTEIHEVHYKTTVPPEAIEIVRTTKT